MTRNELMTEFSSLVTDPRLTLDMVEDHVGHVNDNDYLFGRFRAVTSSGSSGRRGVLAVSYTHLIGPGLGSALYRPPLTSISAPVT